jgi:hypothetical protein
VYVTTIPIPGKAVIVVTQFASFNFLNKLIWTLWSTVHCGMVAGATMCGAWRRCNVLPRRSCRYCLVPARFVMLCATRI